MKMTFRYKLVLSFLVIFSLFTAGIVVFEQSRARQYKTEALEERLNAYAGEMERFLHSGGEYSLSDSLLRSMPGDPRLTLVRSDGTVVYDNLLSADSMENHAGRPEIREAMEKGSGTFIRTSTSAGKPYLYYAKHSGDSLFIRIALPYDIKVRSFLKPDNGFLYFVVALFLVGLGFIYYVGGYFAGTVERLRRHEAREKTRQLKTEMTGNIAHELRTPVTSIRGFLEIVLAGDLDPARKQDYLERAYSQTRTLSELIADMSLLARIDENRGAFEFSEIDASGLVEKVRSDTAVALEEKNITFVADIPQGMTLLGNESLLYSVLRNLTDNVIAHAGTGVEINISATSIGGGMARFTFADTGRGIEDQEHLNRLFERFYRVEKGRTRDTGGSGLGLSIVKNTVVLHGGNITVRNNEPHGLKFVFELPAK